MTSIWSRICSFFGGRPRSTGGAEAADPTLTYIRRHDPEMEAAWQQARDTVEVFIKALSDAPQPDDDEFYVKKRFDEGGETEHIWLSDVRIEGRQFVGAVGNDPQLVKGVVFGDEARVPIDEISDWLIMSPAGRRGGFTLEVHLKRQADDS